MLEDLHEYQKHSVNYIMDHPTSALFLSCGLGKTVIALTAINDLMFDSFQIHKVIVVCPLRVGLNIWKQECENWEHLRNLRCAIAIGTEAERIAALRSSADIYILNRENVEWFVEKSGMLSKLKFDMLIVDESSSFKNHRTKRFKALMKLRPQVKRVVLLSATPAANNLIDLWSQFRLLDMGQRLGRFIGNYRSTFFVPDKRNAQVVFSYKPKPGAEDAIYRLISDITISMKGSDYLKLPELVMNEVPVKMSPIEEQHYQTMKDEMVLSLKGKEIDAANAAALSGKLLQMANGAVYDENHGVAPLHDRKLDALEDLIEAANGKPVLVAYWFRHDLERILKRFPAERLDSADSIKRWNDGEIPLGVIHPASAGHGLNLQAGGSTLVWFGLTWSLELYQQTNARLWRQGQKDTVVIHHIITKGTIDEQVMAALKRKDKTQAALIEAVKANL
ncbi:MAG: DEAD/DEAH box helicase [Ammonifex sp.]|jgi:SNF2 family DNA or RNA helicase|nr:MAG: DEAD/DEAH box helicase [Ammonifex sp.]